MFDLGTWDELTEFLDSLRGVIFSKYFWYWDGEELYSEAMCKLPYIAEHYDESYKVPFKKFAYTYCLQAVNKYLDRSYLNRWIHLQDIFDTQENLEMVGNDELDGLDLIKTDFVVRYFSFTEQGYEDFIFEDVKEKFIEAFLETKSAYSRPLIISKVKALLNDKSVAEIAEEEDCTKQYIYIIQRELRKFYLEDFSKR